MTLKSEIRAFRLRMGGMWDEPKPRTTGKRSRKAKQLYRLYLRFCKQEEVEPRPMKQWARWPKGTDVREWLENKR